jgi:thioredoxin reductase
MDRYDVIIVGGSYAGLSAAMALGRSLRGVLVVDAGEPCNRQTPRSHNFLTRDGETPAIISAEAKAQVLAYPTVKFAEGLVVNAQKEVDGFSVSTAGGESFSSRKLILTMGIKDIFPVLGHFRVALSVLPRL